MPILDALMLGPAMKLRFKARIGPLTASPIRRLPAAVSAWVGVAAARALSPGAGAV